MNRFSSRQLNNTFLLCMRNILLLYWIILFGFKDKIIQFKIKGYQYGSKILNRINEKLLIDYISITCIN